MGIRFEHSAFSSLGNRVQAANGGLTSPVLVKLGSDEGLPALDFVKVLLEHDLLSLYQGRAA